MIAGHIFDATSGLCTCGRRFSDISGATEAHIDQLYWAHTGVLTKTEFDQIVSARERLWRTFTGAPEPEVPQPEDNSIFG